MVAPEHVAIIVGKKTLSKKSIASGSHRRGRVSPGDFFTLDLHADLF
jgi:hypothetical protein